MAEARAEDVDLLIVGGGKAGKSLAMDRAAAGWRVAMVERDKIGGSCINVACIPTKTLVEAARTFSEVQLASRFGIDTGSGPAVSIESLRHHKEGVVGAMVAAHETMFDESAMDFILGTARFVAPRTVEVEVADGTRRVLRGRDVVINTGTTPAVPPIAGIKDAQVWTSESILALERWPASLAIIGGGYIGCEFASMFALLGVPVTILQSGEQLLPREDPDMADAVAELLMDQGVTIVFNARAAEIRRSSGGVVTISREDGPDIEASEVLVAVGRSPVTAELGLDRAGVERDDRGFIRVDERLRTSAENVWAVGDVTGGPQFTHVSWNDFRILRDNFDGGHSVTTGRLVPYTVFTTPEFARVGLSETQAREQGHNVRIAKLSAEAIPRMKTQRRHIGRWKAIVDADTELILGAAILGPEAGEVIAVVQMAMIGGLRYQHVRDALLTHPTMAEGLNLLFDTLGADA